MKLVAIEYGASGHRINQSHGRAKYTDQEVEQAKELYAAGMTVTAIASKLEIPRPTISLWLLERRRACLPVRVVAVRRDIGGDIAK